MPESPALGRYKIRLCVSILPGCDPAVEVTTDFTCFVFWGLPCSPDGHTLSGKQAVTMRAFLHFGREGEKNFCTIGNPDYTAQGCVLYG